MTVRQKNRKTHQELGWLCMLQIVIRMTTFHHQSPIMSRKAMPERTRKFIWVVNLQPAEASMQSASVSNLPSEVVPFKPGIIKGKTHQGPQKSPFLNIYWNKTTVKLDVDWSRQEGSANKALQQFCAVLQWATMHKLQHSFSQRRTEIAASFQAIQCARSNTFAVWFPSKQEGEQHFCKCAFWQRHTWGQQWCLPKLLAH